VRTFSRPVGSVCVCWSRQNVGNGENRPAGRHAVFTPVSCTANLISFISRFQAKSTLNPRTRALDLSHFGKGRRPKERGAGGSNSNRSGVIGIFSSASSKCVRRVAMRSFRPSQCVSGGKRRSLLRSQVERELKSDLAPAN
jgi:hypothetical protein